MCASYAWYRGYHGVGVRLSEYCDIRGRTSADHPYIFLAMAKGKDVAAKA